MKITIDHTINEHKTYRTACVKSLYNVDDINFKLEAEFPLDENHWQLGLIVGSSGSGKSSLGSKIWGKDFLYNKADWTDQAIIDAIAPDEDWQKVTLALSAVGLGSVPAWLSPYHVLSTGEKFRADLANIISEAPDKIVIDEFSSVVDRQIAKIGASAFSKAWRKTTGQAVLLSCHYDIIDWLEPDWVFDITTGQFSWTRGLLRRPKIELEIHETNWQFWKNFKPHHYLKKDHMIASTCYIGTINEQLVAHVV